MKNKILAALAMATPVVATRLSLDGLDLKDDHDLLVADDAEGVASRVIRLLTDPDLGMRLGQNGRRSVLEKYSWRVSAGALDGALHGLASRPDRSGLTSR